MVGTGETPGGFFDIFGWFAEPYDKKDVFYEPGKETVAKPSENLRENEKYREFWGKIYDQGKLNSCVANAAAALFLFETNKERATSNAKTPQVIDPSRTFIWYNARFIEEIKKEKFDNATCHTRNAMKSLEIYGVCDESDCPYPALELMRTPAIEESSKRPTEKAYTTAEGYRIAKYERLDKKPSPTERIKMDTNAKEQVGDELKDYLRKAITEGYPVQFGFHYYQTPVDENFVEVPNHPSAKWSLTKLSTRHERPQGKFGGHAVLAIGYDEDYVICQSSWGPTLEDKAMFLVPWAWITDFEATEDFWIIGGV